jgi:hypothetical protein
MQLKEYSFIYTMRELRKALRACHTVSDVKAVRAVLRPPTTVATRWQRFTDKWRGSVTETPGNGRWTRKCNQRERELKGRADAASHT